jgi:hypothetical protein
MKSMHLIVLVFLLGGATAFAQVVSPRVQIAPPHALLQPQRRGAPAVTTQAARPSPYARVSGTNIARLRLPPQRRPAPATVNDESQSDLEAGMVADEPESDPNERLRISRAEVIESLGHHVDWTRHTASELLEMELRIRSANRIRALGYDVMWQAYSLEQIEDREKRIRKGIALEKKGIEMNWMALSLADLTDIEWRVRKSERLAQLGRRVDWQRHTLAELSQMEITALRLRGRR